MGKQVLVTVIGAPGPGADIPFGWTSTDPEVVAIPGFENFLGQEEVRSVALLRGVTPGTATVTAQYTAQPTEEDEPGQTATAEVTVNVIDAQVVDADVTQDAIAVRLEPSGVSGTLKLELLGTTTHVIREEARASGTYQETFDIPNLAEGEYTKVRATWTVGEASAIGELDYHIKVLGDYNHTRYNVVLESDCLGSPTEFCYTAGDCINTRCQWSEDIARSEWLSEVQENGSGVHSILGTFSREFICTNHPADCRPPRLRGTDTPCPACQGGDLQADGTVAINSGNPDLRCGDRVFVYQVGIRRVTDYGGGLALNQLDHFSGISGCNRTAGTIGILKTIKLFSD